MNDYFINLNNLNDSIKIKEIKKYALENNVPIVTDEGLSFILFLIKITNAKNILEIGTAIGYCACNMALLDKDIHVTTIEKKENMFIKARENIANLGLETQIDVFLDDALDFDLAKLNKKYDLIFIDAAKAQYIKFFEKYSIVLNDNGLIVSDNLLFHGLVEKENIDGKDLRALIRKIKNYNGWLKGNTSFDTTFLRIGDGMAVSIRKSN